MKNAPSVGTATPHSPWYLIPERKLRSFIWIFFSIGTLGNVLPWTREFFIRMVPVTLMVCFVILVMADRTRNLKCLWVSIVIFVAGWLVEVLGVNTGVIFGSYGYSLLMGPALFGTPVVIGLNWLMTIYLSVTVAQGVTMHPFYRTVLAAVLMVIFDFLLEPAAIWMKMWFWEGGNVPLLNYISWFIVSLAFASLFPLLKIRIRNRLAFDLYAAQLGFFLLITAGSFVENLLKR